MVVVVSGTVRSAGVFAVLVNCLPVATAEERAREGSPPIYIPGYAIGCE